MSIARRAIAAGALTLAVLCAPAVSALASTTASHPAISHISKKPHFVPNGVPEGCASGNFCVYTEGNGGDLCAAATGDEQTMGGCANKDQTVFNNGSVGAAKSVVSMNWGTYYTQAWTCIGAGKYWLYTSEYYFNNGVGLTGYGKTVANHVQSFHWQANNCGNNGP